MRKVDERITTEMRKVDERITTEMRKVDERITTEMRKVDERITTEMQKVDERITTEMQKVSERITIGFASVRHSRPRRYAALQSASIQLFNASSIDRDASEVVAGATGHVLIYGATVALVTAAHVIGRSHFTTRKFISCGYYDLAISLDCPLLYSEAVKALNISGPAPIVSPGLDVSSYGFGTTSRFITSQFTAGDAPQHLFFVNNEGYNVSSDEHSYFGGQQPGMSGAGVLYVGSLLVPLFFFFKVSNTDSHRLSI
jgi:hypothetical protein